MKLEKYVDKDKKRRKTILITISAIVLISVSLLLYKTFASFTESAEFPMMKGKVDYFGNSDIYFAFYKGDEQLEEMPQKNNNENLVFERGECDKGASIEWNKEEWGPMVKNLSKSKTKCSLYFKEQKEIVLGKDILPVESGDGLYAVTHEDLEELGQEWNQTEFRYAGVDPDNYVEFNNEIWRIIGLVNVKVGDSVEQRIKIIRQDVIANQKDFGKYYWDMSSNNWIDSKLKNMLNGIYYESKIGECYMGSESSTCDFKSGIEIPSGLSQTSRNMIDKEVIWNIGGSNTNKDVTVKTFYERERGTSTGGSNTYPTEWSTTTEVGGKHNGIGLIYPSDYGYATNGGNLGRIKCFDEYLYNWDKTIENDNYKSECGGTDWLKPISDYIWTLTPFSSNSYDAMVIIYTGYVHNYGGVGSAVSVWPTLYLTTSTKIVDGTGDINSPFVLSIN